MASLISSIHSNLGLNGLDTYVPDLSDSANIRDALELFYYGNLGTTAETFSIYNHLNNSSLHISASANIHGIGAGNAVVGTGTSQTLTNKTLTNPTINAATLSGTITGSFTTLGTITNSGTISGGTVNATTYQQSGNTGFLVPTGVIVPYSASVAPTGWLICNGQDVLQSAYGALFAVIGTTYSGNYNNAGSNSAPSSGYFRIPNLSGRTVIGVGTPYGASYATAHNIATFDGHEKHQLSGPQMPGHLHAFRWQETSGGTGDLNPSDPGYGGTYPSAQFGIDTSTSPTGTYTAFTSYAGGSGNNDGTVNAAAEAHNNMQPFVTLNYIIKT